MKKRLIYFYVLFIISAFILNGCSSSTNDPPPATPINESEELVKYVEANGDYVHAGASFVIAADAYKTAYVANPAKIYTIDIRSAADYTTKHLKGAINVTLANLLTQIKSINIDNYDKVVVACYSGQTAAYGVSLVRASLPLAQANKVVSLKFGMASIDSQFALTTWIAKINSGNAGAGNVVTTAAPAKPALGSLPTLATGKTTGKEILEARINALLAAGYGGTTGTTIDYATLSANFSNYFIANYWTNALYLNPGHLNGAYNYDPTPKPFQLANDLKTLPQGTGSKPVVLYCFTGQTSSYVGAYLRLMGYDARSLLYGANGFMYDLMKTGGVANTFIPANDIKGYKDILE